MSAVQAFVGGEKGFNCRVEKLTLSLGYGETMERSEGCRRPRAPGPGLDHSLAAPFSPAGDCWPEGDKLTQISLAQLCEVWACRAAHADHIATAARAAQAGAGLHCPSQLEGRRGQSPTGGSDGPRGPPRAQPGSQRGRQRFASPLGSDSAGVAETT